MGFYGKYRPGGCENLTLTFQGKRRNWLVQSQFPDSHIIIRGPQYPELQVFKTTAYPISTTETYSEILSNVYHQFSQSNDDKYQSPKQGSLPFLIHF